MQTFGEKVIAFNKGLSLEIPLPDGIRVMNPFRENDQALELSSAFYLKFYNDYRMRRLILGINPGRFGAGVTGIPFTDTRRLERYCGLKAEGVVTHEPSSVFIYEMIQAYGGVKNFYGDFYINSPSPLGFVKANPGGKEVNYNYYDHPGLQNLLHDFIIASLKAHISMGINPDVAFCLGTGKNYQFLNKLNEQYQFFGKLVPLEHPRYVMQYKSKQKQEYIIKYLEKLKGK